MIKQKLYLWFFYNVPILKCYRINDIWNYSILTDTIRYMQCVKLKFEAFETAEYIYIFATGDVQSAFKVWQSFFRNQQQFEPDVYED